MEIAREPFLGLCAEIRAIPSFITSIGGVRIVFRRSAGIAAVAIAAVLALPGAAGAAGSAPGISDTCTNPVVIQEGFLASGTVFFRLRAQPAPDPTTLWVCFRAKVGGTDVAGRIDVRSRAITDRLPHFDPAANSRACSTTPGNQVPGPHPIAGTIREIPFLVDTYASSTGVWVCLEAGDAKLRLIVPVSGVDNLPLDVTMDSAPAPPQPTMDPQPGLPSSRCYAEAYGSPTELVNTDHGPEHLFVFAAGSPLTQHLCVRLHGGPRPTGFDLGVKVDAGAIVTLETSSDLTPCTEDVITLTSPPLISISHTPSGVPPSVCISGQGLEPTRYTIRVLSGDPTPVSFDPDP